MDIILLERVPRLGTVGDLVKVKDGYARNFLLPTGKATRATAANKAKIEAQRAELVAKNAALKAAAEKISGKMDGVEVVIIRQAGETGQMFGSVSSRDISDALNAKGFTEVNRHHVVLNTPIKVLGAHSIVVAIHADVLSTVTVNVARSLDEAKKQVKSEKEIVAEAADEALFGTIEAEKGAGLVG